MVNSASTTSHPADVVSKGVDRICITLVRSGCGELREVLQRSGVEGVPEWFPVPIDPALSTDHGSRWVDVEEAIVEAPMRSVF